MTQLQTAERAALLERFRQYLRDRRLSVTRQRDLVASTVFLSDGHVSVEEIERRLIESGTPVGTATVYRALEVMVESGMVRAHDFGEGFKRYEPMPLHGQHSHLVCERCGRVIEFTNERLERMLQIIADEREFHPHQHRVEVYGLCPECRQRDLEPI